MRWRLLLLLSVFSACSRGPSANQAYATAWAELREGRLQQAQQVVDAALKNHATERPASTGHDGRRQDPLQPLRLLQTEILLARGQSRKALDLLDQCSDSSDHELHLRWAVDRADALVKLGQTDDAKPLLDEVDRAAEDKGAREWVFKGLLLRGAMLARANRFDQADAVLRNLLARAIAAGDSYNQAAALLNISYSLIRKSRFDESIEYATSALDLAQKVHAGRIAAIANDNLGQAYTVLGDLDRAADHQNKAIAQLREIDDLRSLEDALGGLGNIELLAHKPVLAAQAFEEAVEIAKRTDATVDALRWAHRAAFAMIEQQNWDAADNWNGQAYALRAKIPTPDKGLFLKLNEAAIAQGRGNPKEAERLYHETISDSSDNPYFAWDAHVRLASLLASKQQFPAANAEYKLGLQSIERVQSRIKDEYQFSYQDLQMEFFKEYVDLLVTEGQTETALQVVEYSRARVLEEKLGRPTEAIDEVRLANFESYARRTGSVLVSYWLAPKRSFVWIVRPDGIRMRELPPEGEVGDLVRKYRRTIEEELRDPVEERLPQAAQLSAILLGPIQRDLAGAKRVVVVPDGELHALNLETLPSVGVDHYWIEDAEIAVAPSLGVLGTAPPQSPRANPKPRLLLVGAPVSASSAYKELPAARSEIDGIQQQFAGAGVVRAGADATPRGFFDAMPDQFSMIHFAAHAETNSQSPLESAVILSRNGEGGDSYKLYARDVSQLHLSADLVTLSACRSAGARAYGGEGPVGFAWAFLQAGAHSVIAGLWDVSDSSSSRLMGKLYGSLAAGGSPGAALRAAKLTLLHGSGPYRKPFYWAPFQIYIR